MVPLFLFNQMLAAFLRNDGAPGLATAAVLAGGVFNVFGDYFFVPNCHRTMANLINLPLFAQKT